MNHSNNDNFTATEARALFESLQSQIRILAEGQNGIRKDVAILKELPEEFRKLKNEIISIKDAVRISIPDIYSRITALEDSRK